MDSVQPELSDELFELLNGEAVETKQAEAIILNTVGEDGWPHTAMISVGEMLALDRNHLRLAVWRETATSKNIARTGKATFVLCYQGKACYVKLALEELPQEDQQLIRFAAHITAIKEDSVPYAEILSGIHIRLKEQEMVIDRWKQTLKELARS